MFVVGFFILGLLLIGLQTTVFMVHPLWIAAPDCYFILVAYLAYRHDILRSILILFPLGMIFDVVSGQLLGMYPALFLLGFGLLRLMAVRMPVRESFYQLPMIGVCYLLVSWVVYLVMNFAASVPLIPWSWPVMLARAGLVVLFAFPLFRFFAFFSRQTSGRLAGWRRLRFGSGNRYRE